MTQQDVKVITCGGNSSLPEKVEVAAYFSPVVFNLNFKPKRNLNYAHLNGLSTILQSLHTD